MYVASAFAIPARRIVFVSQFAHVVSFILPLKSIA